VKAENKFGFPIEGTLEDWIATQEFPERFTIVSLKRLSMVLKKKVRAQPNWMAL
jgi:hypothetical protein